MEKYIELKVEGLTLRGMLHIPENQTEKTPIVILLPGCGGNKIGLAFCFVNMSRMLKSKGIASVRFDFRHSGESDGSFMDMTLSSEIEDTRNIIEFVKTLDFVDKDKIGIIGLSLGGAVGSIVAAEKKEDVRALCLWNPAACAVDDVKKGNVQAANIEASRPSGYLDISGLKLGFKFVDDALTHDIYKEATGFDKHVLITHGSDDFMVPIDYSKKYLELYGDSAELLVFEGAGHVLNNAIHRDQQYQATVDFFMREFS